MMNTDGWVYTFWVVLARPKWRDQNQHDEQEIFIKNPQGRPTLVST